MGRIVITDHDFPSADLQRDVLKAAGFDLEEIKPICKTEDDVIERCRGAEVLLVQWAPITRRVLEALPTVKCIVRYGIGVNNFDLAAAKEMGVVAANVPDFCLEEVSNHAMAMILSLIRKIPQDQSNILDGKWGPTLIRPLPAASEMTLGLVSLGNIAKLVAKKAKCFGFKVIAFDPFLADEVFAENGVEKADLDTLLAKSDIVSLHCPLVPATTHLINKESIAKMKKGAILINTARGPVVDEPAMIEALQSGQLSSAGLDVFEVEPLPMDSPLRKMNNVILSSHAASVSERAVFLLQTKAAEAARDYLLGKKPVSALF